jgi:hypothetical protein
MTSGRAAIYAELMLHRKEVGIIEVKKIGGAPIGIQIILI